MTIFGIDMMQEDDMLTPIESDDDLISLSLNDPFDYLPHRAVEEAARLVVERLDVLSDSDEELREELSRGKMLGVLVVSTQSGDVGFLSAFSGSIGQRTKLDGFVPPIYDLFCFPDQEAEISRMNREIKKLQSAAEYLIAQRVFSQLNEQTERKIAEARREHAEAKRLRDERRALEGVDLSALQRESQHQRGELRRLESSLRDALAAAQGVVDGYKSKIEELKSRRAAISVDLQRRMFEEYKVVNGRGESRSLYSIFKERYNRLPPSGAGDCAAPKLLHYALRNGYKPLAIGEFWRGRSPRGEVREQGRFYGACHGKCLPILSFMLQGVDIAPVDESLARDRIADDPLEVIFEDSSLVVFNKPAGMLSVRGRIDAPSVESVARERYAQRGVDIVMLHRLDQDTSGVLVVAKGVEVYRLLQRQFAERTLSKRYVALLKGEISHPSKGEISLPLSPNPLDRPRQVVDHQNGREATTTYEILDQKRDGEGSLITRIALYPHTGRTHQLRLHCAYSEGLAAPILGDRLYGEGVASYRRLALHAESITFDHPVSGERVSFSAPVPFTF